MLSRTFRSSVLVLALGVSAASFAAPDPTLHEVYEAARSGHSDQAQKMMRQVLADHPNSAKAHYVAAEIDARTGDLAGARRELATAESLDSALSFAKPEAVQALRRELATTPSHGSLSSTAPSAPSIPWGAIALGLLAAAALWWMFRRRSVATPAPYPAAVPPPGPLGYGAPVPAPTAGGGLLGSLASGVAVGAGVVAGEELVRHLLEPERRVESGFGTAQAAELPPNPDLGGRDFGVDDAGSWDGGGGDDWS